MSTFSGFGHHRQRCNQVNSDNQSSNNEDNGSRSYDTRQPENNRGFQNNQPFPRTSRHAGQHRTTMNPLYTGGNAELEELERQIQEDQAEHLRITREALESAIGHCGHTYEDAGVQIRHSQLPTPAYLTPLCQ
ncbi:Zinc finger protein 850 [Lasiodiplodia theobromae]|uniref:Zinc finger protein 850 n=1 Tax=Lasiodiplodia theobromae TaxID=45133 RepID=UPI0015C36792|nr:Zinc finger protein 850 [Lasiodiplodia theobromae]KAF4545985.1 Zinc finger protein 850 [Lasiodiplodia theobromae]